MTSKTPIFATETLKGLGTSAELHSHIDIDKEASIRVTQAEYENILKISRKFLSNQRKWLLSLSNRDRHTSKRIEDVLKNYPSLENPNKQVVDVYIEYRGAITKNMSLTVERVGVEDSVPQFFMYAYANPGHYFTNDSTPPHRLLTSVEELSKVAFQPFLSFEETVQDTINKRIKLFSAATRKRAMSGEIRVSSLTLERQEQLAVKEEDLKKIAKANPDKYEGKFDDKVKRSIIYGLNKMRVSREATLLKAFYSPTIVGSAVADSKGLTDMDLMLEVEDKLPGAANLRKRVVKDFTGLIDFEASSRGYTLTRYSGDHVLIKHMYFVQPPFKRSKFNEGAVVPQTIISKTTFSPRFFKGKSVGIKESSNAKGVKVSDLIKFFNSQLSEVERDHEGGMPPSPKTNLEHADYLLQEWTVRQLEQAFKKDYILHYCKSSNEDIIPDSLLNGDPPEIQVVQEPSCGLGKVVEAVQLWASGLGIEELRVKMYDSFGKNKGESTKRRYFLQIKEYLTGNYSLDIEVPYYALTSAKIAFEYAFKPIELIREVRSCHSELLKKAKAHIPEVDSPTLFEFVASNKGTDEDIDEAYNNYVSAVRKLENAEASNKKEFFLGFGDPSRVIPKGYKFRHQLKTKDTSKRGK